MANNLGRLRTARGWTQEQAAEALGTTRSQYVKLENGSRRLSSPWINRAAVAYGVDPAAIVQDSVMPPLVGRLFGYGSIEWADGHRIGDGRTVALSVCDNALGPMLADCLVLFRNQPTPPQGQYGGLLAIVDVKGLMTPILRRIYNGTGRGYHHLIGYNIAPEFDQSITGVMTVVEIRVC